jgi:uncharacterized protein involved in outer membrane biogenesis
MRLKRLLFIPFNLLSLTVASILVVYFILMNYDYNNLKPHISKLVKDATNRELTFGGDIDLRIDLKPVLILHEISFQNAPWGSRAELAKIRRLELELELVPLMRREIIVKRLIMVEPDILIETDSKGKSNLEIDLPTPVSLPWPTLHEVRIQKGRVIIKDGRSGQTHAVAVNDLIARTSAAQSPFDLKLQAVYEDRTFDISGTVGSLSALADPDKPWPLKVETKTEGVTVTLNGAIGDLPSLNDIDFDFGLRGNDLAKLEAVLGESLPVNGAFNISGHVVDLAPKRYRVTNLRAAVGHNSVSGDFEVNLSGGRPQFKAALSSQKLDLRPYMKKDDGHNAKATRPTKEAEMQKRVFSDDPFSVEWLKQAHAEVKLRAKQFLLPRVALDDLNLSMVLKGGRLTVKPLKASVGGGTLEGYFTLQSVGKTAALASELKIQQLDFGRMLKALGATEFFKGVVDMELKLKSRGGSVAALMAELNGKVLAVGGEGRLNNEYIDLVGGELFSSLVGLVNPVAEETESTEVNCFVLCFDIQNGLADATALVIDTDRTTLIGGGQIDLKTEELDLALKPSPKEGLGIDGVGKISLSLGELTKPFKVGGTLAEPALAIDATHTAITLGKSIGGIALFGPIGMIAALASTSAVGDNPCLEAIQTVRADGAILGSGEPAEELKREEPGKERGSINTVAESNNNGAKKNIFDGIGSTLDNLFSTRAQEPPKVEREDFNPAAESF